MSEQLPNVTGVEEIPVLALRDVVVYPQMVIPLFVGREKSIRCLDIAMESDKQVFLVAQKDAGIDDPSSDDVYTTGTVATILQMLKLPDGTVKVLVEGGKRAEIKKFEVSVFNGEYITNDIDQGYLERLDSMRNNASKETSDKNADSIIDIHNEGSE